MRRFAIEMTLIAECGDDERSGRIERILVHKLNIENLPIPVANTLLNGIYEISEEKQ